ncbi:ABC transporter permease subunit [Rossellomorea marisflavi]|uniref:ABC transporter permease subunit n=1 Tax=Rossellomorea marisflavi TaxID=189381 RepID=UPI00351351B1
MLFFRIALHFTISVVGIWLIGGLPVFLSGLSEKKFLLIEYWTTEKQILSAMFHPSEMKYLVIGGQKERDLFPVLWDPIEYSLTILFASFILAILVALTLTIITMLWSEKVRTRIKFGVYLLETLPDLLIILVIQLVVVALYKNSGLIPVGIAATDQNKVYLLPIILLAILPTINLFRLSILSFEQEEQKDYVLLARSIGHGRFFILVFHILRNAITSVFFQSKKTMWFMLSNLYVIELLFNIPGITRFLMSSLDPRLFTVILYSIFVPLFIFYNAGGYILARKANKGELLS